MEIVINKQYGGFSLSPLAIQEYLKLKGEKAYFYDSRYENKTMMFIKEDPPTKTENIFLQCFTRDFGERFNSTDIPDEEWDRYCFYSNSINRTDKDLIKVVKELGDKANTIVSDLKIIEIPDDIEYEIEEYDGFEWVSEKHMTWG